MTSIQTIVVEPGTPELAICARWRVTAFSVLQASFEEELRSLELFTSDQTHGVALVAKVDGEPIGTCLLVGSEIERRRHIGSSHRRSSATAKVFAALPLHHRCCRVLCEARLVGPRSH